MLLHIQAKSAFVSPYNVYIYIYICIHIQHICIRMYWLLLSPADSRCQNDLSVVVCFRLLLSGTLLCVLLFRHRLLRCVNLLLDILTEKPIRTQKELHWKRQG